MGLDLTLVPVEADYDGWGFGHTMLDLERRRDLFTKIIEVEPWESLPVPRYFGTYLCRDDKYEEPHYGDTQETPYGEALRCAKVKALLPFSSHDGVRDDERNRAAWAYLASLSEDRRVALYWH